MAQMYTIHVHAIPLSDGDGKGANTVSKETFREAVARLDLDTSQCLTSYTPAAAVRLTAIGTVARLRARKTALATREASCSASCSPR